VLVVVLMLCAAGLTAAVFQHEVASQTASCAMGLADKIVTALGLEELWPSVFMITANCAEAAGYRLLGLPYEVWSGLLFAGLGAVGLVVLNKR
jgi:disulfide bond formation protein DsbB